MSMITVHRGTSRVVIVRGDIAVKFPRRGNGRRCNLYEAGIWQRNKDHPIRGAHLCPVLWCHPEGRVLIMPAASPLPDEVEPYRDFGDWWDYQPGGDEWPGEPKAADWGLLEGRFVLLDYSAPALAP
jgi:hypothetical protein